MKRNLLTKTIGCLLIALVVSSCGKKEEKKTEDTPVTTETSSEQKTDLNYKLEWTAFKTPEKVGVKGSFDRITLTDVKADKAKLEEALKDSKFLVEVASVMTNDTLRDEKLRVGFFDHLNGNILGSFGEFKNGKVPVSLTMNGVTKEKTFNYEATDNSVKINGAIDIIADFSANKAFETIHELCKELHLDKTWTDVELAVEIKK